MKNLPWIGMGLLGFLVISTQIPATADIVEQARLSFTDEQIAQGREFAWQRRWIFWAGALSQLALLVYLVFTPLGKRLYLAAGAIVHGNWFAHLILMFAIYYVASIAISFPFRLANYFLNLSWEMSNQSITGWLHDFLVGSFVTGLFEGIALIGLYVMMRVAPGLWWLFAGALSVAFGFGVAFILPSVIAPLFNEFRPISSTEWKSMEPRIRALTARFQMPSPQIYVTDASRQSSASNAYFTGFGSTQRIVLYDNLLKNHSEDEVDTVIAHELGHWWNAHILQGILIGGAALTVGLFLLYGHLNSLVKTGALRNSADPAGMYRVIFLLQMAAALTLPIQNAISREMERQADFVSLEVSKKPLAFIEAEKNLSIRNKSNVAPSRWNVLLFATHPPVIERIQMAEQWMQDNPMKKRR